MELERVISAKQRRQTGRSDLLESTGMLHRLSMQRMQKILPQA